ncbi:MULTISPECIES: TetR/AcrR family transcriptional regulator [Gordonia]|uniref:Putative TetR family transcriptional regulator n=1 Tax=Gordonia sputi NBRC 100414 TaxID=1089453 RepID=H5U223_9ACTN|nr:MULTISPECIES: TetR/AcrR family transcriptional regulator [Gordonia]MCM3894834.1 TetR/AcrR family transcriptional regulator [Gordonia sputi]NKY92787.1 TetR/AcrR family transcriptional regulator [Gordonia sputi]OBA35974.1 TetR family transcriptional regulator [Gordonia sp. 852002-51296_SCH5728562-b]OBA73965.1 TetR family transcriptional regulator [Gordonia sp. 852002-10350_SCH5691597]GAB39781.1 putative TetR family transcriptional regulator [Gordonia sputi NBRC 100414]
MTRAELATRRRTELFDGLLALMLDDGFAHLQIADLAARLHCSRSTLYTLAGSKEQLVTKTVTHFFRTATDQVESRVADAATSRDAVVEYLIAVGDALSPASAQFMADLHAFAPTRELYEQNTAAAAARVRGLIAAGVAAGEFRDVDAAFAGDLAATMMSRIQRRDVEAHTGLDDAQAYRQLASILTRGIDVDRG